MRNFTRSAVAFVAAAFFCGCLEFGNDIHLVGSNFTNNELNEVTKRTNI